MTFQIWFFWISALHLSAHTQSVECASADSTCSAHTALPATGEALLQSRKAIFRGSGEEETDSALPQGAKELFDQKLCKENYSHSGMPREALTDSTVLAETIAATSLSHPEATSLGQRVGPAGALRSFEQLKRQLIRLLPAAEKSNDSDANHTDAEHTALSRNDSDAEHTFSKSFIDNWEEGTESLTATLDEAGYTQVAELKNDQEMKTYIYRVAQSCNMKVVDEGGLNGVVGWFSGATEAPSSFENLKEALFSSLLAASDHHWVAVKNSTDAPVTGETAAMDFLGYAQVRSLRDAKETITYVRRMVENMGVKIIVPAGFDGLMGFYSEPDASGSFQRLVTEIKRAAQEHSWAALV